MKKSKKIGIVLSVIAIAGGAVIIPAEYTYAAEIVVSNQDEFNALPEKEEWSDSASLYLNNSPSNNTIKFIGITTSKDINGGRALKTQGAQNAQNNTLILTDCIIVKKDTDKGTGQVFGGYAQNGSAINNTVIINGSSEIHYGVYGGDSVSGGDAIGNTVIIAGDAKIYGEDIPDGANNQYIYGGFSYIGEQTGGRVEDNTVIIRDNADISNTKIYGGFTSVANLTDDEIANLTEENFLKKNNTVIFDDWSGSVKAVRSCDNVNFYNMNLSDFVSNDPNTAKPILTITGDDKNRDSFENIIGSDNNKIEIDGSTTKDINIGVSFQGGQDIKANETIRLVKMTGGATVDTSNDDEGNKKIKLANDGTAYAGVAQVLKGELNVQEEYIDYTIKSVGLNDQVNVVNEGRAASAAFLNQSDELISEALAGLNLEDKYGFETFAMVYGNDSRYGTNSDLSINGWSGLVGVGSNNKSKAGDFAWAAFFENGAGNYDISTTMNGITMEGDGSTVYNGGGIAARLTGENGVYGEASLRAGLLKNDLEHGLQNQNGETFGYESESNYYGMHIGIGKIFKLENGASVDTYAKYYHSTVKDDSFTIDSDRFEMDDINSDRLRLGISYNQGMDRTFNVYYGAAWEYEFNGESNGYAQGHKMEETSLKGSTVIGELGVVIQPENSPWSFDAKVKGYGGQRDGYSGSILATYHF